MPPVHAHAQIGAGSDYQVMLWWLYMKNVSSLVGAKISGKNTYNEWTLRKRDGE